MGKEEQLVSAEKVRRVDRRGIAVLAIENPPLATLTSEVRTSLLKAVNEAVSDPDIAGIVLAGTGDIFAAGASVAEASVEGAPDLSTLCDRLEAADKPVVAAIQGSALGGGLELALAAHVRVARPAARLGSPEITVGLVPNAGGTQRLPKVVGGIAALKMLLSGRAVSGESAAKLGLVDVVATGDVVEAAVETALKLSQAGGAMRRSSERRDRLGEGTAFLEAVATHRQLAAKSPLEAPLRLIECVEAALLLPYEIGRGLEEAAFEDLVDSEHSKSLRHIFAAERKLQSATRWEGRTPSRPLKSVAIIGARAICAELAVICLDAGFQVTVAEDSDEALENGVTRIIEHYDARVAKGTMSEDEVEQLLERMAAVSGFKTLSEADIVIDPQAVSTRTRVGEMDSVMRAGSVLTVATEGLDLGRVAKSTERSVDVLGLRFPPGLRRNRLVEFSALEDTSPKAMATARALMRKLDRLILDVAPGQEAVFTALLEALHAAADLCLEDGASVPQVDAALKDWGIPYGSFSFRDIVGLSRVGQPSGLQGVRGGGLDEALIAAGRLGLATGQGYYQYTQRGRPGAEDPAIARMIEADRLGKGIQARRLSDGEVRMRCVAAMAGAGARLLADERVRRPADIDMVAVHALGFARRTGGIMFVADLMGLAEVRAKLAEMAEVSSRIAPPPAIFDDLIGSHKAFSDLNG